MYRICHHHRKGQKANGTPLNVALEDRTVFEEAKDSVISVWTAVDLLNAMTVLKLRLTDCLTSGAIRLIVSQIATAAATTNTDNNSGVSGDEDGAVIQDETLEQEMLRLLFAPLIFAAIEQFVARVKSAPFGTRLEDMFPETLERESGHGANDESDGGRATPIAIPSIEDPSIGEGDNADSIPDPPKDKEKTPPPFFPEQYTRVSSSELPDPDFRVALEPDRQQKYDALEKGWEAMHPNHPTRLEMEEMTAAAKREAAASARHRPNNRRGKKNQTKRQCDKTQAKRRVDNDQALPPTPPQSSQPARDQSPDIVDLEASQPPEMEEEEEEEEVDQPLLLHAGHSLGVASTPAPPETEDNIMHTDFDEYIWEFEPDLPLDGPSSSGPPEPSSSHPEQPSSPIVDARRPTPPEQTPGPDLRRPTPARFESGLFVPQKVTPVRPPEPWWLTMGKAKREETIPPLSVVVSRGTSSSSSRDASTRPPSQPPAAERRQRSAGASEPSPVVEISGAPAGTFACEQAAQEATAENQQRPGVSSSSTQPRQSEDRGAVTTATAAADPNSETRPAAKKPRKTGEKSKKAVEPKNNKAKKQKGKDKGKGKEVEKGAASGQTRPEPAAIDTRYEEALRQQLANTEKPRRATYIGAPALSSSIEDLRRREKTITMPPVSQMPTTAAAAAAAAKPAPVVATASHDRNEPAMSSSSQTRASQGAPKVPRKKPESNRNATTTPSPPDKQRQKQQHIRHQSICPTFEGTHIRLDDNDEPAQRVLGQDRGATMERVASSSPAATTATRSHFPSEAPPPVQPQLRQSVEGDRSSHNHQGSPTSQRQKQRNKAKWANYKERRRNRKNGRDPTTMPPSPVAPLVERRSTHENERGQGGSSSWTPRNRPHSTASHRGSAMPPPPPPAMNKVIPEERQGSAVPPPAPAGPPRGRYLTPWEWQSENSASPEQRKRSRGTADPGASHNKRRRTGSSSRHGTADIIDLTSVPHPGPSSSSYSFTYATASTAAATSIEEQQAVEFTSSAPPRQQAEDDAYDNHSEQAYTCKRRFMSVPPPLDTRGRYRVAEVAHTVNELHLLRMEKRLMNLESQLGQRE